MTRALLRCRQQVSGGAAASGYSKVQGYYVAGSLEAEASWFGKGAADHLAKIGQPDFFGRVDDQTFSAMLVWPRTIDREGSGAAGWTACFTSPVGPGWAKRFDRLISAGSEASQG